MSFQETLSDYQGFDFDRFFAGVSDADVTRSLAKEAIEGGKVEVNQVRAKPSRSVHVMDEIMVQRIADMLR